MFGKYHLPTRPQPDRQTPERRFSRILIAVNRTIIPYHILHARQQPRMRSTKTVAVALLLLDYCLAWSTPPLWVSLHHPTWSTSSRGGTLQKCQPQTTVLSHTRSSAMASSSSSYSEPVSSTEAAAAAPPPAAVVGEPPHDVTPESLDRVLAVAVDAGRRAGGIIVQQQQQHAQEGNDVKSQNKANARDLLTEIDTLCERTIRDTVVAAFPEHAFLGEEDVPPGKEAAAAALQAKLRDSADTWLWIVDPIDGTTNVSVVVLCVVCVILYWGVGNWQSISPLSSAT